MNTNKSPQSESVPGDAAPSRNMTIRRFLTRRTVAAVVLLVTALGAGATAVNTGATGESSEANAAADESVRQLVETTILKPVDHVDQKRTYTGIVSPRRTTDIGFERSARLMDVKFDEGDEVQKERALATLDTRQIESRRREMAARLASAKALLAELKSGPRRETIAAAQAQVADLKSQLELRKLTFRRTEKLRRQNAATDQDIDDSRLSLKSTEARLNVAQKQLDELQAGTRQERIDAQQANVEQLVASLEDIDIELDNSVLKAPFSGKIATRYLDEGTVVTPGQPVLQIVEHQALEARIGLPLPAVNSLAVGNTVDLRVGEVKLTGKLSRILPEIDVATRTQIVVFDINGDSASQVVPGQVVHTTIIQRIEKRGFLLPTAALLPGVRGMWSLFAVIDQDGNAIIDRRHAEILHTSGDQVLVRGTIATGDRIVISGVQRLVSGMQVRMAE